MQRNTPRGLLALRFACLAAVALATATPAVCQIAAVDPDSAAGTGHSMPPAPAAQAAQPAPPPPASRPGFDYAPPAQVAPRQTAETTAIRTTYRKDELIAASEGAFGKSARDVAVAIGDVLKKQGEPNGYIVGKEGGGAFVFGLRYGSGTLHQKMRDVREVYWTGPSVGFDAGGSGGDTFVLVYNLTDPETLFSRFGAGEGQAYMVGGMHVSYLRRGNVVLIPVRMGVGIRLGVNAGYMKFTRRQNIVPF